MNKILILSMLVGFFFSCKPEADDYYFKVEVINSTDYYIEMNVYYFNYDINTQVDSLFTLNSYSSIISEYKRGLPISVFGLPADSVYVTFDNSRRLIYRRNDGNSRNILDYDCFESRLENGSGSIYQYFFTIEDFENAIEIK